MSKHGPFTAIPSTSRGQWSQQPPVHCSESVSSSASSLTYHMLPPYGSQHYVPGVDHYSEPYQVGSVVRHPLETGHPLLPPESTGKYLLSRERGVSLPRHPHPSHFNPNTLLHIQPPQGGRRSVGVGGSRAATPVSTDAGGVLPCGGHCVPLENFCHHCLQVIFLAGVLSGICLVVAGSLLSSTDLAVLTYIGSLTAMVSGLLLSIQCCVKRGRPRQPRLSPPAIPLQPPAIPLQELGRLPQPPSAQPLLIPIPTDDPFKEESGIPWWRRERPLNR